METVNHIKGVCDIRHTVHADECFRLGNTTEMVQPDQGVCNGGHTVHSDKQFRINKMCDTRQTGP